MRELPQFIRNWLRQQEHRVLQQIRMLSTQQMKNKSYDGIRILRPSVTWKLNNLKGYAKSAKEPGYAKYTEEDWKKCSTEKAV